MSADQPPRPTVLVFHKISSAFTYGVTNYSPRRLQRLLDSLSADGWGLEYIDEAGIASTQQGGRSVTLSFDDGYEHLVDVLLELIRKYRLQPLVFVPSDLAGHSNKWDYSHVFRKFRHLSRDQIRRLSDVGVVFGSHGATHQDLTSCDKHDLKHELSDSRKCLQDWSGQSVETISYPFGRCNRRVRDAAEEAGYRCGYTMTFPTPEDHPLAGGRVPIYSFDTPLSVRAKLGDGFPRNLEQAKCAIVNRLSGGTIWLNRLRGARRR